jgi:hypothetical protein
MQRLLMNITIRVPIRTDKDQENSFFSVRRTRNFLRPPRILKSVCKKFEDIFVFVTVLWLLNNVPFSNADVYVPAVSHKQKST